MTTVRTYTLLVTIRDDTQPTEADLEKAIEHHLEETVGVRLAVVTALVGDQLDGGYMSTLEAQRAKALHFNMRQP